MSSKFNFNLTSVPTEILGDKTKQGIYVELPIYNDLLGQEYTALEEIDRQEQLWAKRLLDFAEALAERNKLEPYEIVDKLLNLDSMTFAEQLNFAGHLMPKLVSLKLDQPSIQTRRNKYAHIMLQSRVDASITYEDVVKLPAKLISDINDFLSQEQFNGKHQSYESLKNNYDILLGKATLGEQLILAQTKVLDNLNISVLSTISNEDSEEITKAETAYWEYEKHTKKLDY